MMNLLKGNHPAVIAENMRMLREAGHPEGRATAIALQHAQQHPADLEADGANGEDRADGDAPLKPRKMTMGSQRTIKPQAAGQKPIHFKEGGLHASTGTKPGVKIPAAKHLAAREGKLGPKAEKQEVFYDNVLKK